MKRGFLFAWLVGGLLLFVLLLFHTSPRLKRPHSAIAATTILPGDSTSPATSAANPTVSPHPPVVSPKTATPSAATRESEFTAFAGWAQRWLTNDPTANALQGEALAWKRREAMLELIETDPARALALAVPFQWRRTLPENVTRHFERWIDAHLPVQP